jgi:hypothetical protein
MTRRKREIVGLTNERDFPHLVELALPPGGFRSVFLEFDAFHREQRIPVRRGRSRHEDEQFYIRLHPFPCHTVFENHEASGVAARPRRLST